jgi:hypothetical protein
MAEKSRPKKHVFRRDLANIWRKSTAGITGYADPQSAFGCASKDGK